GHAGRGRPRDARPDLRRLVRPDLHELPVDDAPLLRVEAQHGHLRGALERADAQLVLHGAGRAAADVPHAAAEPDRTGAGVHVARDLVRHARRVERLVAHARGVDEQEVDAVAVLLRRARDLREPGRVLLGRLLARGLAPEAEPRLERVAVTQDPDALDLDDLPVQDGLARSEEHTSELQSRENLVCRLLLEKKKKEQYQFHHKFNPTFQMYLQMLTIFINILRYDEKIKSKLT